MAPLNGVCTACTDPNCLLCESQNLGYCHLCATGYLYEGLCLDCCPQGTYIEPIY